MIRRPALLLLTLLAGCGGHHGENSTRILPLSPYGTLTFSNAVDFNGSTADVTFLVRSVLTDGTLVLDDPYGDTSGKMPNRMRIQVGYYSAEKGGSYELIPTQGGSLRIHDFGDGSVDRVWEASGGKLVDKGSDGFRHFRLENVTIVPIEGTGATGTAILSGEIDSALLL